MNATIEFNPSEFNKKIKYLSSNGFKKYLTTEEEGVTHVIMTNTIEGHFYNGWTVDIYSNGKIEYGNQFKNQKS